MNNERVSDLLFRAQAEQEPSRNLKTAIRCTVNDALAETWAGCLGRTMGHGRASTPVKAARRECL